MRVGSRAVRFAVYGGLGLAAELVFTGAKDAFRTRGRSVRGRTSAWMFPVYGLAQPLFEPAHDAMRGRVPAPVRALVYAAGFTGIEYASGRLFRLALGETPWDYSHVRWNLDGLIRADYVPLWAAAGLALERVHDALAGRRS
jgi:uncharacterized membrane protein